MATETYTSRPLGPALKMERDSKQIAPFVYMEGPWRYYVNGREVDEREFRSEEAKWRQPVDID